MKQTSLLVTSLAILLTTTSFKPIPATIAHFQTSTPKHPSIAGLWIGTYSVKSIKQRPLYFSFTIYPDGTMSYKSRGSDDYTFYANGTWTLTGKLFIYTVTTTNSPGEQQVQVGHATYANTTTLKDGINKDTGPGALVGNWSMKRVN